MNQLVYSKALDLSNQSRKQHKEGAVLSYMQIDANKLNQSIPYLHMVLLLLDNLIQPFDCVLCTCFMYMFE